MKKATKVETFLKKNYKGLTNKELADALRKQGNLVTTQEVQSLLRKLGLSRRIEGRGELPSRIREIAAMSLTSERAKESAVYEKALKGYEAAHKAMRRKKHKEAEKAFALVAQTYAQSEPELADRARTYEAVCSRLAAKPESQTLRSFESAYEAGLFAFNERRHEEAEKILQKALAKAGNARERGKARYVLASLEAGRENEAACLEYLRKAIKDDEQYRFQFRYDFDFMDYVSRPEFRELLAPAPKSEKKRKTA
jgi:tetratricopeptide (TPR) repeat protein